MRLALPSSQDAGVAKMKALRTFFMEDWLESFRFTSKFNLGESGGKARTVKELLFNSGLSEDTANEIFLNTLCAIAQIGAGMTCAIL